MSRIGDWLRSDAGHAVEDEVKQTFWQLLIAALTKRIGGGAA